MKKLEHIGIMAKNIEESIRFYTEIVGMRLDRREKLDNGVELVFLHFPGQESVEIELISRWDDSFSENGIVGHVAFTVDNIEQELERLKQAGVRLIDETPRTILGGIKIAFFYGPSGEQLEMFQPRT
ncbi:VOC family protein [Paenibacillus thermotolerans]|uniref:VOC family protein n=1 Tax=Paenibacillus thermotolerans TaxID=3027807 RepID=UPI0023682E88|nr:MULTISPECIES: VOC family protein [unclassified Paenibacillus]